MIFVNDYTVCKKTSIKYGTKTKQNTLMSALKIPFKNLFQTPPSITNPKPPADLRLQM